MRKGDKPIMCWTWSDRTFFELPENNSYTKQKRYW